MWRPWGSHRVPSLVVVFDLSARGARLAGWDPVSYELGDALELSIDRRHVWQAVVVRILGDGEYGVRFSEMAPHVKERIIRTVGLARAGRTGQWA
jgi:PilZ domain